MFSLLALPDFVPGLQMGKHPEPPSQGELVFAEVILYRSVSPLPLQPLGIKSLKPRVTGGWSLPRTETVSSSHNPLPSAEGVMASHPLWLSEHVFSQWHGSILMAVNLVW